MSPCPSAAAPIAALNWPRSRSLTAARIDLAAAASGLRLCASFANRALARSTVPDLSTVCPWKGVASYWRAAEGGDPIAWAYEDPRPEVAQIRGYIAFYQNKVTVAVGTAPYLAAAAPKKT